MNKSKGILLLLSLTIVACIGLTSCGDNELSQGEAADAPSSQETTLEDLLGTPENYDDCLTNFTAEDLDGKKQTQEIFAANKYTLVDIWATYCGPCIQSMPANQALYKEYKDKGVGVVAIVTDAQGEGLAVDEKQVDTAKSLMKEAGATYPCLLLSQDMKPLLQNIQYIPTYLLVDKEGKVISQLYVGAQDEEKWRTIFDALLEQE